MVGFLVNFPCYRYLKNTHSRFPVGFRLVFISFWSVCLLFLKGGQEPFILWLQMFPWAKAPLEEILCPGRRYHQCSSFAPSYLLTSMKTRLQANSFTRSTIKGIWTGGRRITRFSLFSIKYGHVSILNMEGILGSHCKEGLSGYLRIIKFRF